MIYNIDTEKYVLSGMLNSEKCLEYGLTYLKEIDFWDSRHQHVFINMQKLSDNKKSVDCAMLASYCDKGYASYISSLLDAIPALSAFRDHCTEIRNFSCRRAVNIVGQKISDMARTERSVELISIESEKMLLKALDRENEISYNHIEKVIDKSIDNMVQSATGQRNGIYLKYPSIDKYYGWFSRGSLIVIAGRPGMGKSMFMGDMMYRISKNGIGTGIFSLEMNDYEYTDRYLSAVTKINNIRLTKFAEQLTIKEQCNLEEAQLELRKLPIYIEDNIYSLQKIYSVMKRMKKKNGVQIFGIDHLQLMDSGIKTLNRNDEIAYITKTLKRYAKELQTPIILLSQLNRSVDTRGGDHRPGLSDLRESGAIEQDADAVIFLYREDYYKKDSDKKGILEVMFEKYRGGPTGKLDLIISPETCTIIDQKDFV